VSDPNSERVKNKFKVTGQFDERPKSDRVGIILASRLAFRHDRACYIGDVYCPDMG
jgi:hypothetical protein